MKFFLRALCEPCERHSLFLIELKIFQMSNRGDAEKSQNAKTQNGIGFLELFGMIRLCVLCGKKRKVFVSDLSLFGLRIKLQDLGFTDLHLNFAVYLSSLRHG